jgi:predicted flap endonuclease-1-like 5' DNA nuclease
MSYLLTQMFLYMLCTFLLGLLLGWLFWRYGKPTADDYDKLVAERDRLLKERDDLNVNLDACRARSTKEREAAEELRGKNIDLQNRLDAMSVAGRAAAAAPVAAAPAAEASSFSGTASKPEGLSGPRGGRADDLKEINGVGPKMEDLLNSLGYYHFDQIAAWKPSEVAWVDDNLEGFKGRVTRDQWQLQARKLARG